MQNRRFIEILDELKDETSDMLLYGNMMDSRIKEKYLRKLEKIRYELFENVNLENKYSNEEDISFVNNKYKARKEKNILNIYIPEVLPKYKNISSFSYKNIMTNVAECTKGYKDLFQDKLTLVIIVVHEKQKNMDIDNKYVKPIIDGLVTSGVIKDDNFSNMFYIAMGKNDTKKPYTEVFVLDGKYIDEWIEDLEKLF